MNLIEFTRPALEGQVRSMTMFVCKLRGEDGKHIRDLELYYSTLKVRRVVPHKLFEMIADVS